MNIVVINGMPRAGKDLFVSLCKKYVGGRLLNVSTVDKVKEIATECGWDGVKSPKNRKFLSDLKDLLTEWGDVPYKDIERKVYMHEANLSEWFGPDEIIAFIHCREPEEIQKFKDRLGAKTLIIRRDCVESNEQSNHADSKVFDFTYDYTISNNGTIEELEKRAVEFLNLFPKLKPYNFKNN